LDILGEGGMGVVYSARQSSIARTVAVKMLKPSAKVREEQRDKFISEAVVTGELDHPNIVPIYDLGANEQGALFYSMKRVRGTPWDKVINEKQIEENLNILLRVADAVAFAHDRGVIHRDLKPENIMLGDYGEVLVMDLGLARVAPEFAHVDTVYQVDSLGGTPAYMAPEMARGPIENISKTSDIYLLGAILYEIIGGQPPHSGRDVMQCLMAASQNRIDAIRYEGELKDITLKAMATKQQDRYANVKEFQEAIRTYQSHSESLVLTAHANQNLRMARESDDYQLFARALYGSQEALTLWDANQRAKALLTETQRDYAKSALGKGDRTWPLRSWTAARRNTKPSRCRSARPAPSATPGHAGCAWQRWRSPRYWRRSWPRSRSRLSASGRPGTRRSARRILPSMRKPKRRG
jgi:serine/threonine protein kinase